MSKAEPEFDDKLIDIEDVKRLRVKLIEQAILDYTRGLHPRNRRRKHLREAFATARDMLFDSEYRLLHFDDGEGHQLSLQEFLSETMDDDRYEVEEVKKFVIEQAVQFWETKDLSTVEIPTHFAIDGHAYMILPPEDEVNGYAVDYEEKIIYISSSDDSENQEAFILAVNEIIAYHLDIRVKKSVLDEIGRAWFRTLRMNNCFTGA